MLRPRRRAGAGAAALVAAAAAALAPALGAVAGDGRLDAEAAEAAALEHRFFLQRMEPWNRTLEYRGYAEYPIDTPNEAACRDGEPWVLSGRAHPELLSRRARSMNEAGYAMCPQRSLRRRGCVIYSCGVDEDPAFEIALARWRSNCEVFAFDPSPAARRWMAYLSATSDPPLPVNLHFLPWGWGERDAVMGVDPWGVELTGKCGNCLWPWDTYEWGEPSSSWQILRPSTVARRFNHTRVDLIKMDCEGPEYADGLWDELLALAPEQIILEQHDRKQIANGRNLSSRIVSPVEWVLLQERLHRAGFRQVWKGRLSTNLGEYTFARRDLTDLA
eukprot:TRINITY_DN10573_c0_g1_i1.p1 TRINITY_DN10573_c0_g1~~TRINITY_DN10573_c0_g1_i1.p1  ORF type:complete len:332 (-),score=62.19 TRINITY_DN10573_c0_g1_i1:54-1049(-)